MSSSIARTNQDFSVPPPNAQVTSYCWVNVAFLSSQQFVLAWSLVAVLCTVWSVLHRTPGEYALHLQVVAAYLGSREARISGLHVLGVKGRLVANLGLEPSLH